MEKIGYNNTVINFKEHLDKQQPDMSKQINPQIVDLVSEIFVLFKACCRGFMKQFEEKDSLSKEKTNFMLIFQDLNITKISQIERGLKRTRLESPVYTPRIADFLKWCEPTQDELEKLGVPHVREAFRQAANRKWSHKVVYNAWAKLGAWYFSHTTEKEAFKEFENIYSSTIKKWLSGDNLQDIPGGLLEATSEKKKANLNLVNESLREMRACLGI